MRSEHLVLSVILLGVACGTRTIVREEAGVPPDPYGDPPGYSGDPFAGYGPLNSITLPAEETGTVTEPVTAGPWSVQVAACGSAESAESVRNAILSSFDQPVFINHLGDYWKVRVGAFATSEDSAQLRELLREEGYPDAWSVERDLTP